MGSYFSYPQPVTSKYGWKKDKHDERDYFLTPKIPTLSNVDLRDDCPLVYDQGELGSCTANAIAAAYEYDTMKQGDYDPFTPSRLFIYYNERDMEGDVKSDSGAAIRDGIKSINKVGVCPEYMWPYDTIVFADKPTDKCYECAINHRSVKYHRVRQDLLHLKGCLEDGFPIVFGFTVYESFESKNTEETGDVSLPGKNEKILGGHAVLAVGYDDERKVFIVRNSWGPEWGDEGYCYMPYDYLTDELLATDFWVVNKVRDEDGM